ncbi:MAG: hypothetical protein OJF51_004591 [Nitrospira sp.]|jgi:hypothetical protein|nr:MAG: hypothetical protein OJF51_004591 [Nitrospira sp.]
MDRLPSRPRPPILHNSKNSIDGNHGWIPRASVSGLSRADDVGFTHAPSRSAVMDRYALLGMMETITFWFG